MKNKQNLPEFGSKVSVNKMFIRSCKYDRGLYKYWKSKDIQRKGIYLGKRKLANGKVIDDTWDGTCFIPVEYVDAALICFSERENPVYVPLEEVKL